MEKKMSRPKTDLDILREHHKFVHETSDPTSWENELAKKYDAKLHKEYAICDLSLHQKGKLGLRWRTEQEVLLGKGESRCGDLRCNSKLGLKAYEVFFRYVEQGDEKEVLVKVMLCELCAEKLNLYRLKKRQRAEKRKKEGVREIDTEMASKPKHCKDRPKRIGSRSRSRSLDS